MKKKHILGKFIIVSAMIGLFSPSVSVQTVLQSTNLDYRLSDVQLDISLLNTAEARPGGLRKGGGVHRKPTRNRHVRKTRNRNINRNVNRNINRNVNVNVNHRYYGGRPVYGGFYRGGGYYYGGVYHPVAAFTFTMLTAMAIGSIISSASMSSSCRTMNVSGINYKNCDGTWFKPFYDGSNLQYEVVSSPY